MLARLRNSERAILSICLTFSLFLLALFFAGRYISTVMILYLSVCMVGILLAVAWARFGFRHDNNIMRGEITRSIVIAVISYGIIAYALGIFLGFNYSYASLKIGKIFSGLVPAVLLAVALELLRYIISDSFVCRKRFVVLFTTLSILLYIILAFNLDAVATPERIFIFICTIVFATIARESLCSYLSYRIGILPTLVFKLTMVSYMYILPFVPNLGNYIYAVAHIILPFVIFVMSERSVSFYERDENFFRRVNLRIISVPVLIIAIGLTVLVSGIFKYQMIAIGSDSMNPTYARGDAVIFEKASSGEIQIGDILVFKREGLLITHRVIAIEARDNTLYFTTQGDNNEKPDGFETDASQVIGRVVLAGKYIGFPTIWINELFNNG